ncbi:MAG: class I SAM-dependent methyltransferase, partial [Ilumatobacter sp.]|nr:class I SAM-dependent methyltransferase [Ilumatobacter sp.]
MRNYDSTSYGDAFADVYDEWYADVTDVAATVVRLVGLAGPGGRVLELGAGTGRLAAPMAVAGLDVVGIDSSAAMLARIPAQPGGKHVTALHGDMVRDLPD